MDTEGGVGRPCLPLGLWCEVCVDPVSGQRSGGWTLVVAMVTTQRLLLRAPEASARQRYFISLSSVNSGSFLRAAPQSLS